VTSRTPRVVSFCLQQSSASEVTTLWRYRNLFVIITIIIFTSQVVQIRGVKN